MSEQKIYQNLDGTSDLMFRSFLTKTFSIMSIGLLVTAAVAYFVFQDIYNGGMMYDLIVSNSGLFYILFFVQIGVAIGFTWGLNKMSPMVANILFFLYSAITGVTFGVLPLAYGVENMFYAFGFTAVLFISVAIIGHTTSVDISRFSGLLIGGLIALIVISVASMFINLSGIELIVCYLGVIIFLGLTAWDTQKLKQYYYSAAHDDEMVSKLSIYGAFQLYLDFINLFLYILRILGRRGRK